MENEILSRDVRLYDLIKILIKRLWIIILAAIIVGGGVLGLTWLKNRTPDPVTYTSTTTIRVVPLKDGATSVALTFMPDLTNVVRHTNVIYSVYEELQPQLVDRTGKAVTYQNFLKHITFEQPSKTRFLHIIVVWHDADVAKTIANTISEEGMRQMSSMMSESENSLFTMMADDNVTRETLSNTNDGTPQSLISMLKDAFIGGVLAAIIAAVAIVIIYFFDNRIHSGDNLERMADVAVLGSIPYADTDSPDDGNSTDYRIHQTGGRRV